MKTPRITRPLPKNGEADCPQCGSEKSVARHNADWTCHKCGFREIVDEDLEAERIATVNLLCCVCHQITVVPASPDDPPETHEIRGTTCPKCDHGGWDSPTYYRVDASEIKWVE